MNECSSCGRTIPARRRKCGECYKRSAQAARELDCTRMRSMRASISAIFGVSGRGASAHRNQTEVASMLGISHQAVASLECRAALKLGRALLADPVALEAILDDIQVGVPEHVRVAAESARRASTASITLGGRLLTEHQRRELDAWRELAGAMALEGEPGLAHEIRAELSRLELTIRDI